ncbi:unnamed protein product, partial [Haemonchus placei]|uniref:PPM-type phosphatase domain-containing protein n=1 Tax=Haemonchus placei TaxID=6290 RepID=A0A0N4VVF0_HAEPC
AHERSITIDQDAIARIDTCQLAANSPIEDFYSAAKCELICCRVDLLTKFSNTAFIEVEIRAVLMSSVHLGLSSNAYLFGVFDGHGGQSCSRHVSVSLFPYICASVLRKHEHTFRKYVSVREALKLAFEMCDEDLCRAALPDNRGQLDRQGIIVTSNEPRLSVMTAASGSCATLAHVRKRNLHVANVGDSAAVLGVVNPNGSVIARQLSRAHCVDNTDEVQRIRASHPTSEIHVLRGGRLLGELYPLRAFGDVRFKWPLDLQKVLITSSFSIVFNDDFDLFR